MEPELMVPWSDVEQTWGAQCTHAERLLATRAGAGAGEEAARLLGALLREPLALLRARPDTPMRGSDTALFAHWVERRMAGEELAHITGHLAFMELDLAVERGCPLVSPAAQRLVEVALQCARARTLAESLLAEIGAGCGAITLALATFEPRFARIYAVDPSPEALRVAAANGARYLLNLVINWRVGDGLDAIPEPVDMIICDASVAALASRATRLFAEASGWLRPGGALLCALDATQESSALASLQRALPDARIWAAPLSRGATVTVAQTPGT